MFRKKMYTCLTRCQLQIKSSELQTPGSGLDILDQSFVTTDKLAQFIALKNMDNQQVNFGHFGSKSLIPIKNTD